MSDSASELKLFLNTLYSQAPAGSLVEMRYRAGAGMRRRFFGVEARHLVAGAIHALAPRTDVYLGVLPRRRPGGGRDDLVREASVLWADCDSAAATMALRTVPTPSIVVASGSANHHHAYWLLSQPVPVAGIESANRRLARVLDADVCCADAARILRAAPSLNHKRSPATPVQLERCEPDERSSFDDIVRLLPEDDVHPAGRAAWVPSPMMAGDPLLAVPPPVYVERLLGVAVPRHGKVRCPFHDDRTPSLHVYAEAERGWYCYGCGKGGSIYDLAALLADLTTRGQDFLALRRGLLDRLALAPAG